MTTPSFDWDHDINLPVAGRTSRARHASATGAQHAGRIYGAKVVAYLRVLARFGEVGLNDYDAAELLGIYRTSVNSIRANVMATDLVEETGAYDETAFGTRRQRYRLTEKGLAFVEAQP